MAMSMKTLWLLHERDPEYVPKRSVVEILEAKDPITWTDLRSILRDGTILPSLMKELERGGRLSKEKYNFVMEAEKFLAERRSKGPKGVNISAYESIYDVVWYFPFLERSNTIFRGQFRAQSPLESTLLRPEIGSERLDIKTLVERVQLTEAFISELRSRQLEILGTELDDRSLLAIAQHFRFPTPLLDFTRSLEVAAFFATLGARNWHGDEPMCGVIYYIHLYSKMIVGEPGRELGIPLLDMINVHVGELDVIEPDILSPDNRIRRQNAVFIKGFQMHDLGAFAVNRLLFWQQPGVVLEDPRNGIDEQTLLPDRTCLSNLAREVRERQQSRPAWELVLGTVELPQTGIIGSKGALLEIQIEKATTFLAEIAEAAAAQVTKSEMEQLSQIIRRYFEHIRAESYVELLPEDGSTGGADRALFTAVSALAAWSNLDERMLWDYTFAQLEGAPSEFEYGHPTDAQMPRITSERNRIGLSMAMYLASWEHLRHVDGKRARRLVIEAMALLKPGDFPLRPALP